MWNDLSVKQKAELMKIYLQNGITSLSDMKAHYNEYSRGGHLYQTGGDENEITSADNTENYKSIEAGRLGDGYWVNLPEDKSVEDLRFTLPAVTIRPEIEPQYFINKNNEPFSTYNNYFNNSTLNNKISSDYEKQIANSLVSTANKQALLGNGYTLLPDNRIKTSTGETPLETSNIDFDLMTLGSGKVVSGLAKAGEKFAGTAVGKAITEAVNNPYINGALSSYYISNALANNDPNYGARERTTDVALNLLGLPAVMNKGYNTFKTITSPIYDNYNFIKHINTQAGRYGYPAIKVFPNILSTKKTNKAVQNLVDRHNTFVRGVRVPAHKKKLLKEMKKFGYENPTEKEMIEFMATTGVGGSGGGRAGIEDISEALGTTLEDMRANYSFNYSSNSNGTAYGYATTNEPPELVGEKDGAMVVVRRPTKFDPNRYNWFQDNDFELLSENEIYNNQLPTHLYYGLDLPEKQKRFLRKSYPELLDSSGVKYAYRGKKSLLNHIQNLKQKPGVNTQNLNTLYDILTHLKLDPNTTNDLRRVATDQQYLNRFLNSFWAAYEGPVINKRVERLLETYKDFYKNGKPLFYKWNRADLTKSKLPIFFTTEYRIKKGPGKGYQHYIYAGPENKKIFDVIDVINPEEYEGATEAHRGFRSHVGIPSKRLSLKQPGLAYGGPLQLMDYNPKTGTFTPNTLL